LSLRVGRWNLRYFTIFQFSIARIIPLKISAA
jgi:hypothetical protein